MNSGIFYYCGDEAQASAVADKFAQQLNLKPHEYYKIDDIDHYFVKTYDRVNVKVGGPNREERAKAYAALRAQSLENQDPAKVSGHTACSNTETVQNVLYAYYHLSLVRNKVSHAEFRAIAERRPIVSESDLSYAMMMMKESIEYFIMSYENALEEVRGTHPKIVTITPDDVRKAADRIWHERKQKRRTAGAVRWT